MASTSKVRAANYTAQQVIALTNEDRSALGLSKLSTDAQLMQAAMDKARDMFAKGYWDHYGPNGETPWQFIRGEGIEYTVAGENLGKGFSDVQKLNQAWLNSPAHRANIVKPEYNEIGVAVMDGMLEGKQVTLVVQMFVKEKTPTPPAPVPTPAPTTVKVAVKKETNVVTPTQVEPVVEQPKEEPIVSEPVPTPLQEEEKTQAAEPIPIVFEDFRIPTSLKKKSEEAMLGGVKEFLEKIKENLKK
jgi:hypothetical protein